MNERSQGGGVIDQGTIELMQNRRLLVDDNLGVDEPLNEEDMIDGLDDFETCSELACLLTTQDGTEYDLTTLDGEQSFIERIDDT